MFALSYAQRAGLMAALPVAMLALADKPLFDEVAGALVTLDDMSQVEAVLHAFEAQRIEITSAIADSIVAQMSVSEGELYSARLAMRFARDPVGERAA